MFRQMNKLPQEEKAAELRIKSKRRWEKSKKERERQTRRERE